MQPDPFLNHQHRQIALRDEAVAIHEHYHLTGLHVSEETADAWLAQLEIGNDVEPPVCQN